MRGEIISKEYQNMVWVKDENGKDFACYSHDIKNSDQLTNEEKSKCLDTSQVLGDSW